MCRSWNVVAIVLFVVINFDNTRSDDVDAMVYKSVELCKKSERYDLDLFQCVECEAKDSLLVPSTDRSRCECQPNTYEEAIYDSTKQHPICRNVSCKSCTKPETTQCGIKYIDSIKRNATNQKAVQIFHSDSRNCSCDTKSNLRYHNYCIAASLLRDYQHFNSFQPERDIYSELRFIAFFCKALRNTTACNHLANLCVTSFYSLAKNSPCTIFYISQASDAAVYSSDEDSPDMRPFLFYRKMRGTQNDLKKPIDFSYSLHNEKGGDLQLVSTMHLLDGTSAQIGRLMPYSVNYCKKNEISDYNRFIFGLNYESGCKFTLENLMDMSSDRDYFYSVYLNYTIGKVQYLQPIPILIRNAFKFNEAENPSDWQLVKRFQLYDSHELPTNRFYLPNPTYNRASLRHSQFKMIRYIDHFEMSVTIHDENRISLPLIILHYKTIYVHRNTSLTSEYHHKFVVRFTKTYNLDFYLELMLPLTIAIGFMFAILRTYNYKTRRNKEYYDISALCQFVLYLFSNCANALFFVAVFLVVYVFFVTTGQKMVKLLVPIKQQDLIDMMIGVAFTLKLLYLTSHFWRIVNADVFFIDWERPRGYDTLSTHRSNSDTPSVCSSVRSMNSDTVSAWRNFFVANEWIKLSVKRKTSILFQNFTLLICIEVFTNNFQSFANPTADKTIKLALVLLLQFALYAAQTIINFLLLEKIYGNPLHQFTDVCSTANISVFVLVHDSFGFYVHGRSPHGFSDVDMSSIIIQLQREAHNMCGRRGLLTGSDNQSYIILVPSDFRMYYNKLLTPFQKAASISQSHFEKEILHGKSADYTLDRTTTAYSNINRFFCAFIDHSIKDLDYIVKERTCVEVLLNCEFESYLSETKGTFYIDNWQSFGRVLLYGNDFQIFLCELMLFCLVLVISDSVIVSTFVMSIADQIIFRRLTKRNVANKTLIDRKFLI